MSAPIDLEAQTILSVPTPVLTYTTRTPASERDPLDNFFGQASSAPRIRDSRHDTEALPAYVEDLPPNYALKAPEPLTLARYLFKFGFLFPPFWIMGAWILWSPLRAPSDETDPEGWLPEKTETERKRILEEMRRVEVRWALRCLWSIIIFTLLAIIAAVATWAIMKF
ncbi:hypothetical protein H0H81_002705 [Sphagnurus paluster]|uniref:Transmembrane protein n=1 Tax=Sphagnurus paluster TaxID=117069 RepID=A0A9P7GLS2_9AGAR|nr:hypothetical protein H0H81_002705 [Sphagnurus paluster]